MNIQECNLRTCTTFPAPNNDCVTVSGGTVGVKCVFPFKYQGKEYKVQFVIKEFWGFETTLFVDIELRKLGTGTHAHLVSFKTSDVPYSPNQ